MNFCTQNMVGTDEHGSRRHHLGKPNDFQGLLSTKMRFSNTLQETCISCYVCVAYKWHCWKMYLNINNTQKTTIKQVRQLIIPIKGFYVCFPIIGKYTSYGK